MFKYYFSIFCSLWSVLLKFLCWKKHTCIYRQLFFGFGARWSYNIWELKYIELLHYICCYLDKSIGAVCDEKYMRLLFNVTALLKQNCWTSDRHELTSDDCKKALKWVSNITYIVCSNIHSTTLRHMNQIAGWVSVSFRVTFIWHFQIKNNGIWKCNFMNNDYEAINSVMKRVHFQINNNGIRKC